MIAVSHELRVCDLIDEDTRQWDRGKLLAIFTDRTRQEILNIPLTNLHSKDTLTWKENRRQKFSVKTAYRVAMQLSNPNWADHSMAREHSLVWNKIWSLNVPPKVRTFLWRACSNCLPTRDNLHRRRVSVEPHCEICQHRSETVSHILWECPLARNVWAIFKGRAQKCSNTATDFFILFQQLQLKLDQHELERWAVTTWAIWNARNRIYFEHFQTHPKVILELASGLVTEYQRLQHTHWTHYCNLLGYR